MKVTILGTRGNIKIAAAGHVKHSGILIDERVMLDVGEQEYLNYKPEIIFVTHLHPDHAFFINDSKSKLRMRVYAPDLLAGVPAVYLITAPVEYDGYLVTPLPLIHSLHVRSVGYVIEKGEKKIFYTGDLAGLDIKMLDKFGKMDMVITEASFVKKGGLVRHRHGLAFGHLGIPDIVNLFKNYTNRIIFTHFGSWFVKNVEKGTEKIKSLEAGSLQLEVAADGMTYRV